MWCIDMNESKIHKHMKYSLKESSILHLKKLEVIEIFLKCVYFSRRKFELHFIKKELYLGKMFLRTE